MRRLTTRQRFAFIFSFYVFLFFLVLFVVFIAIFDFSLSNQIKRDLYIESTDVINDHLFLDNGSLTFKKDEGGESLREQLLARNMSAAFLDTDKNVLRTYGVFALTDTENLDLNLQSLVSSSQGKSQTNEKVVNWRGQKLTTLAVPLKSHEKIAGYMVLSKSSEEYLTLRRQIMVIFASLGLLSLLGSFIVGYLSARQAFLPLVKMIRVIERIDFDKLDAEVSVKGHRGDELVRLGEKFNDMMARVKDMSERQKSFIANASHELKTPLTRAISSLDLLSMDQGKNLKDLDLARAELFQINTLLEKLLLLTKTKKDIRAAKPYLLNTADLTKKFHKRFDQEWRAKKLTFIASAPVEISTSTPKEYLLMILTNLLSNATKYTPEGKRIFFDVTKSTDCAEITIKDEGEGMEKQETRQMFDRFWRAKGVKKGGYGIGLSIVKQICDLFDIAINVITEKGKGTTISLVVPIHDTRSV